MDSLGSPAYKIAVVPPANSHLPLNLEIIVMRLIQLHCASSSWHLIRHMGADYDACIDTIFPAAQHCKIHISLLHQVKLLSEGRKDCTVRGAGLHLNDSCCCWSSAIHSSHAISSWLTPHFKAATLDVCGL